jgi:hypothetical protein
MEYGWNLLPANYLERLSARRAATTISAAASGVSAIAVR